MAKNIQQVQITLYQVGNMRLCLQKHLAIHPQLYKLFSQTIRQKRCARSGTNIGMMQAVWWRMVMDKHLMFGMDKSTSLTQFRTIPN